MVRGGSGLIEFCGTNTNQNFELLIPEGKVMCFHGKYNDRIEQVVFENLKFAENGTPNHCYEPCILQQHFLLQKINRLLNWICSGVCFN